MDPHRPNSAPSLPPGVVPLPANAALQSGRFDFASVRAIHIATDSPTVREVAYFLARESSNRIGRFVKCTTAELGSDRDGTVTLTTETKKLYLSDEGYDLDVGPRVVTISAPHARGLLRGGFTLLQSIDADGERGRAIPSMRVIDKPSVPWRALRIDVSRCECSLPWLARMVDVAAMLRLNAFRLALRADTAPAPWHEDLANRCRERGLDALFDRVTPAPPTRPFRIVRLTAPASASTTASANATSLPAEELDLSDSPLPSVEEIHACAPEAYALAEDHRCIGLEAWIDALPDAGEALLERAYLTRLAAFSEVAWTGPFRRTFSDFRDRLARLFAAFDHLGVDYDVPPPCGVPELIEFETECAIELVPPLPGSCVAYTLDGTDPTAGSTIASAPLFLRADGELRARTVLRNGKSSVVVASTIRRRAAP